MIQVSIKDTRNRLAEIINQVHIGGDQFIITKFGEPKAIIAPIIKTKGEKLVLQETFGAWGKRKDIRSAAKYVNALRTKISLRR
jgi:prevent-host-death family protein